MRLTLLFLAYVAAFGGLPHSAHAESARETFDRLVNEPGNQEAFSYIDAELVDPIGHAGVPDMVTDEIFGEGALNIQISPRGRAMSSFDQLRFGAVSMNNHVVNNIIGASAKSSGAFRDFWTFGGGTGTGTLIVRGFASSTLEGEGVDRFESEATLTTSGSFGHREASFSASFVGGEDAVDVTTQCGAAFSSSCEVHSGPGDGAMLWSLTLPFEYGGSASFVSRTSASIDLVPVGSPFAQMESSSDVFTIELPEGATLRAASNRVLLSDGAWVYSDRPVTQPVPEASTWALMVTGLAAVAAACRRREARFTAGGWVPAEGSRPESG